MNEVSQTPAESQQIQSPEVLEPMDDLLIKLVSIQRKFPKATTTQTTIAEKLGYTQGMISRAMKDPVAYPDLAKKIDRYLNKRLSQLQSTKNQTAVA